MHFVHRGRKPIKDRFLVSLEIEEVGFVALEPPPEVTLR